jgi:subtilisin family serine protease
MARENADRYIVVTVRNDIQASTGAAASTPRGYDSVTPYVAGSQARAQAKALATNYRLQEVAGWPIAVLGVHCLVYRIAAQSNRGEVLDHLKRDPMVESAQALGTFSTRTSAYNDTYVGLQRNLEPLAVAQAQLLSRGAGVRVAVIDTGIDTAHADLKGRTAQWRNFVDGDAAQFRRDRHGTAVAGVIGAMPNNRLGIVGIAPGVKLHAYKACWETGAAGAAAVCNSFTLAQALAAAIEAHADVVNLSLAGPSDALLTRLVRNGQRAGIIFVGAAPPMNSAQTSMGFPVDVPGVIGVEASETSTPQRGLLAAPGVDIFTLTPQGHYDAASGSSLATAEVSAVVALLKSQSPDLSAAQAQQLLAQTSRSFATASGSSTSIDAGAALAALRP